MRTLLILTCAHDLCLTRNLFKRIARVDGWQYFTHVHLHLDHDVSFGAAKSLLAPLIPYSEQNIRLTRSDEFDAWHTRRTETMLIIYKLACSLNQDIVRLDPDLYIVSSEFFEALIKPSAAIAGKLMPLYPPAFIQGRRFDFIQGGASYWGEEGRAYLQGLRVSKLDYFRRTYKNLVDISFPDRRNEYEYFFNNAEDVLLSGALAIIAGIERTNIPRLQVSSYDIMPDYRSEKWAYTDFVASYVASGALAYHFEGAHDGRRALMTKMLQQFYWEQDSLK